MLKFGEWVVKHKVLILVFGLLLMIPAALGYLGTRVNYDILSYLPSDLDTMVGQDILIDDFGKGGFSFVVYARDGMIRIETGDDGHSLSFERRLTDV